MLIKGFVSSSLILSMNGVFAHNIWSTHTHQQAVPLSLTSTVVLGILLIFTGLFILPRMQGRHIRTLAVTSLLAGIIAAGAGGKLINEVLAAPNTTDCIINNANSSTGCPGNIPPSQNIRITNSSDVDITVNSAFDAVSTQRKSHNLEIVEIVKGPIKRSIVAETASCVFPQILAPSDTCIFNHTTVHSNEE